jgi:hypothetical protein
MRRPGGLRRPEIAAIGRSFMSTSRTALGLVPVALVVFVACSASGTGTGTTSETMPTQPMEAGPPVTPKPADAGAPANPPKKDAAPEPDPGECSSEKTQTACVTCCSNKHMDGSGVYFAALLDCMCTMDNCAKDCAKTLCDMNNPQNADAQCQACVSAKNNACAPMIKTTCLADPDCTAFDACIGKSDCTGKTN